MIRINLLVEGRKKKRKPIPVILLLGIVITVVTLSIVSAYTFYLSGKMTSLKEEKVVKEKKLKDLKEKIKTVEDYERENKIVADKTKVIEQLKKNQKGPVKILDELSKKLPKGVWLTKLQEKSGGMTMEGSAFSNPALVTYVQNLKNSQYFTNVNLVESKQKKIKEITVYQFKLTCKVKV